MRKSALLVLAIPLGIAFYFVYVGIGWTLWVSVSDWTGLIPSYGFEGFSNYVHLFNDPVFWTSLKNSLMLFLAIPVCIGLGLLLATLLDQGFRGGEVFRNIYLLPFALSYVVTGTMWAWMYNPSNGILNTLFGSVGLDFLTSSWHTSPETVMMSIIIVLVWQFSGYTMLILLAGMKSIPQSRINAAKLDGASGFKLYRKVVYPQLKTPILTAFVILMMFALRAFDLVWVLTGGGPGYSSHILPIMMYKETFQATRFAYGSAIASILLAIVLIIVIPYLYKSYKE